MPEFERKAKRVSAWQYQTSTDPSVAFQGELPGWLVGKINGGVIATEWDEKAGRWDAWAVLPDALGQPDSWRLLTGFWILCDETGTISLLDDASFREMYEMV